MKALKLMPSSPRPWRSLLIALSCAAASPCWNSHAAEPSPAVRLGSAPLDFRRDIEPIFVKRCSECHGPDKQKNDLRLDIAASALRGGKSGKPAIVPGKSADSEVFRRVTTDNADDSMPPKGDPLSPAQIELLRSWIDQGAVWPETDPRNHWAFIKPARPATPSAQAGTWPRNEMDRFILARLEKEGLAPSPEADRATLIRRVSFDLIGLPPTIGEVDAFLNDHRPDAYEQLVERLLASPHFGENVGRWWLDLARYADSNGYQVDLARSIWPYRDWVINAFNRNMPFDQFTIEQLAGDLLHNATLEQKIATGFNRNTKINDEGGGDAEEYRTKAVKDRAATVATTWMGLTMMCAECHTHKYDPITQDDYYRFYAFFNSTTDGGNYNVEPTVPVPAPDISPKVNHVRGRLAQVRQELSEAERNLPLEQAAWEQRMADKGTVWRTLALTNVVSTGGSSYTNLADGSVLATGSVNPIYDTISFEADAGLRGITAVMLEVLPDPSLPKNGPGRWGQTGNFILDEFALSATPLREGARTATSHFFSRAVADWEQQYYRAEHAVDRNPKTGWAIGPQFGKPHLLIAELQQPAGFEGGTRLTFKFEHYHGNSHTIGRFRISISTEKDFDALWPVPTDIQRLVDTPEAQRTPDQFARLAAHFRNISPTLRTLERELFRLNQRETELAAQKYSTLVLQERPQPRETYVHVRGNFLEKGTMVTPGVPALFPPLPTNPPPNRLALAQWLVAPDNPLTARVTVNRLWERIFGVGLVKTSEDFGRQGEPPSHPELLDWLACEFMAPTAKIEPFNRSAGNAATLQGLNDPAHPWDIKHILRLLVTSATYRQSSTTTDKLIEKDLYNRLLAHGPRFRLDGETIRDQALAVSGLLNPQIGGPSAYPIQVPNLWKEIGFLRPEIGMDEWPTSDGPDMYRRGVYAFWRRVCTYPTFATFDAPSREVCVSRRPRTNTPLQALAGLNELTLVEAARILGQRILNEGGNEIAQQMEFAFRLCLARPPTNAERERLVKLYEQQLQGFQRDPQAAETLLLNAGPAPRPQELDARRLAAWMMVANVLLNLDETLTKG